jgi:uncharacterized protein YggE
MNCQRVQLMILGLLIVAWPNTSGAIQNEVAVTGSAATFVKSFYVTVHINISSLSKKAAESTRRTAELHGSILSALNSIDVLDIHTQEYRVAPRWEQDDKGRNKKFLGYQASHSVIVSLSDTENIGQVVDTAIQAGAKNINSINFHYEVPESLQQILLAESVDQARERAETIAAAAGGRLGDLIEISTQDAARAMRREIPSEVQVSYCRVVGGTRINPQGRNVRMVVLGRWKFIEGDGP